MNTNTQHSTRQRNFNQSDAPRSFEQRVADGRQQAAAASTAAMEKIDAVVGELIPFVESNSPGGFSIKMGGFTRLDDDIYREVVVGKGHRYEGTYRVSASTTGAEICVLHKPFRGWFTKWRKVASAANTASAITQLAFWAGRK